MTEKEKVEANFICVDCGFNCLIGDKDYYMVKHNLWKKHGVGEKMLCMNCFELRLGHQLTAKDILVCPVTTQDNPYTRNILNKAKQKNKASV